MGFALGVGQRGPLDAPPKAKLLLNIRLFGWARFGIGNSVHLPRNHLWPKSWPPSSGQFVLVIENVGPSFYFSGMRQRAAMLELRASIVAINPAPTNLAANELGFVGRSGVRVFDHSATMSRSFWSHSLVLAP